MNDILVKPDICDTFKDYMDKYFSEGLKGLELEVFLDHVAECDKCLQFILQQKEIEEVYNEKDKGRDNKKMFK